MSDSSRSAPPNKLPCQKNILCNWFFLTSPLPSLPQHKRQSGKAGLSSHHFVISPMCVATSQRFWKQEQQFNSSEFIGVIRIVFLEPLSLEKFIHIHLIRLLYTDSDFRAWEWKAGSSVSSNCQRTNHQATVCYLSSRTFFITKFYFHLPCKTSVWSFYGRCLRLSTYLLKIPIKVVLAPENIIREEVCCICCTFACTVLL